MNFYTYGKTSAGVAGVIVGLYTIHHAFTSDIMFGLAGQVAVGVVGAAVVYAGAMHLRDVWGE